MQNNLLDNQTPEFIEIFHLQSKKRKELYELNDLVEQHKIQLKDLNHKLYQLCNHKWVMDDAQYQTPTSWTCYICGGYK